METETNPPRFDPEQARRVIDDLKGSARVTGFHLCDQAARLLAAATDEVERLKHAFAEQCGGTVDSWELLHSSERAAFERATRAEHERDECVAIIRDLRRKLAEAGVEGSPPPGEQGTIPSLLQRVHEITAERDQLRERVKELESRLT